jgi:hypothetical protein
MRKFSESVQKYQLSLSLMEVNFHKLTSISHTIEALSIHDTMKQYLLIYCIKIIECLQSLHLALNAFHVY